MVALRSLLQPHTGPRCALSRLSATGTGGGALRQRGGQSVGGKAENETTGYVTRNNAALMLATRNFLCSVDMLSNKLNVNLTQHYTPTHGVLSNVILFRFVTYRIVLCCWVRVLGFVVIQLNVYFVLRLSLTLG